MAILEKSYEMPECQLDKITVYYETIGQGTPLLVLPGWTASANKDRDSRLEIENGIRSR